MGMSWIAHPSVKAMLDGWQSRGFNGVMKEIWRVIPAAVMWTLWKERNSRAFDSKEDLIPYLMNNVLTLIHSWLSCSGKMQGIRLDDLIANWDNVIFDPAASDIFDMTTMMNTIEEDYQLLVPDEITTEILSRLPAESVMQCKLVCKTWRALIIDPAFINMQITRSISYYTLNITSAAETTWVVFPKKVPHGSDYQLQLVKYDDDHRFKKSKPIIYRPITITHPIFNNNHHPSPSVPTVTKIRSCNGLIFMATLASNMFVCNPFTREYVDLPLRFNTPRLLMNFSRGVMRMASGFGYHSSTNEYKVVIIYYNKSHSDGQVTIYTLGSGEWRDNGEISHRVIDGATGGVLFNGGLHWLTEKMDEIVSFDLADEEFRIVPSPPSPISQPEDYVPQLGLLEGCLYVTRKRRRNNVNEDDAQRSIDIWVMDSMEYTWSKKFNISWKAGLSNHRPLTLLESGKILLHHSGERLISYDPETESSIVVDESEFRYVYPYITTFVSLKELGEADAMIFDPDVCESLYSDIIESRKREAGSTKTVNMKMGKFVSYGVID